VYWLSCHSSKVSIVKQKGFPMKNAFRLSLRPGIFPEFAMGKNICPGSFEKYAGNHSTPATWPGHVVAWQGCVASLDILPKEEKGEEDPYSQIALYSVNSPFRVFPLSNQTQTPNR
jgi:hypothetical protein